VELNGKHRPGRIYYYHPVVFNFNSGMTLQIIRDLVYLCRLGYEACLFGTYTDEHAFAEVRKYIGDAPVRLTVKKGTDKRWRGWLKFFLILKMLADRDPGKIIFGRVYGKMRELIYLRPLLRKPVLVLEFHENAFPHLLPPKHGKSAPEIKDMCQKVIERLDGLSFNNFSQEIILKKEFRDWPSYFIFPNGVEWELFSKARPSEGKDRLIVTYTGQFTGWKNIGLLFEAVALLDDRFVLRIAGGKGDEASRRLIEQLTASHGLDGRVEYLGFISPEEVVSKALDGSSVLALPLGDNMESRYFTSPMKLFEYMATGIPVVAVDQPSVRLITGEDSVFLSPNEPTSFAMAIMEAAASKDTARTGRMNAIARRYTYEKRAAALDAWLTGLSRR
jgi:glycosyltransferase involved in cell wall biosynthesis